MTIQQSATGHVFKVARKRGDQWYAKYRLPDGKQIQKRLGPAHEGRGKPLAGHYTKKTAEAELRRILTDADRGKLVAPTGKTFADAAAAYLSSCVDVEDQTRKDYAGAIRNRLNPKFGERKLEGIKPAEIEAWQRTLRGEVSNRTIVRYLTVMHSVFRHARVADNPASADNIAYPKVEYSGEFDTYERDEIDALVAHAETKQDGCLFLTAALTGLRQGELLALRWRDVDLVTGRLHVRRNYTGGGEKAPKSGKVRAGVLVPDVVDALARLKDRGYTTEDDDLVFCNTAGDHLCDHALRRRYYRAIKAAGLRRIRFHDLRHHFATVSARVLSPSELQYYMGHASYSTTQRYLHHQPRPEDARKLHEAFRVPNGVPNSADSDRTDGNSEPVFPHK